MEKYNSLLERRVIQFGITVFWILFWLFNVIDKFIGQTKFFLGTDRLSQFTEYFSSIGIEDIRIVNAFLNAVTVIEITALILALFSFFSLVVGQHIKARRYFFWATFTGLALFSLFTIGDQVFGDRHQLLEHTTYWIALIISWGAYTYFSRKD